ncbi:transposase, partial [Sinorhizobium sp. 8-89]|uniref:transposase n=1 Tax=Sinorhizobium sp. 7-81 TaxID=3049087 RepID=UPI0024C37D96
MIEAVAERLEGAPRQLRRRWSDEFKAQAVAEALEPGASVSAIAHWIGIHPSQLFAWRRDARNDASPQHSAGEVASVGGSGCVSHQNIRAAPGGSLFSCKGQVSRVHP